MGLDMVITKLVNTRVNEKGNTVYEYENIADLRNTWEFLDNINGVVEFGLNSGATMEFSGATLWEEVENISDKKEHDEVKEVLEKANIINDEVEYYNISAWW